MRITITEALAEIKTIGKRQDKKRSFITQYIARQERMKDPLEKEGGSRAAIAAEVQALDDLERRILNIRREITRANMENMLTVHGVTMSIYDWLTWRRDVAPVKQAFFAALSKGLGNIRSEAQRKGVRVAGSTEPEGPDDVIVNIDEKSLAESIEELETVLGTLDGLLSLANATIFIGLGD